MESLYRRLDILSVAGKKEDDEFAATVKSMSESDAKEFFENPKNAATARRLAHRSPFIAQKLRGLGEGTRVDPIPHRIPLAETGAAGKDELEKMPAAVRWLVETNGLAELDKNRHELYVGAAREFHKKFNLSSLPDSCPFLPDQYFGYLIDDAAHSNRLASFRRHLQAVKSPESRVAIHSVVRESYVHGQILLKIERDNSDRVNEYRLATLDLTHEIPKLRTTHAGSRAIGKFVKYERNVELNTAQDILHLIPLRRVTVEELKSFFGVIEIEKHTHLYHATKKSAKWEISNSPQIPLFTSFEPQLYFGLRVLHLRTTQKIEVLDLHFLERKENGVLDGRIILKSILFGRALTNKEEAREDTLFTPPTDDADAKYLANVMNIGWLSTDSGFLEACEVVLPDPIGTLELMSVMEFPADVDLERLRKFQNFADIAFLRRATFPDVPLTDTPAREWNSKFGPSVTRSRGMKRRDQNEEMFRGKKPRPKVINSTREVFHPRDIDRIYKDGKIVSVVWNSDPDEAMTTINFSGDDADVENFSGTVVVDFYSFTGARLKRTEFWLNGALRFSEDEPSYELLVRNGDRHKVWIKDGKWHRETGPAHVVEDGEGTTRFEEYYEVGVRKQEK